MNELITAFGEIGSAFIGSEWAADGAMASFMIFMTRKVIRKANKDVEALNARFTHVDESLNILAKRQDSTNEHLAELRQLREDTAQDVRDLDKCLVNLVNEARSIKDRIDSYPGFANGHS